MTQSISDVVDHLSALPPFPKVTTRLFSLLNDDSASATELANVISADPSLSMRVVHLANSPFYMLARPVLSVKEAVLVLGMNTIKNITTAASLMTGLSALHPRVDVFDMSEFWKHSNATAIAAHKLAVHKLTSMADSLYLAGLIHDIGKVIVAYHWPESWKAIVNTMRHTNEDYWQVEQRLFHGSHAEIAASLCTNWRFPKLIVEIVQHHHAEAVEQEFESPHKILSTADYLARATGLSCPAIGSMETADLPADQQEIARQLPEEVEYQLSTLERT
ncbi:MAG: HDOD domain-containing protein [bacterium]|nr:HDOD domain-containing protein [bacterium]